MQTARERYLDNILDEVMTIYRIEADVSIVCHDCGSSKSLQEFPKYLMTKGQIECLDCSRKRKAEWKKTELGKDSESRYYWRRRIEAILKLGGECKPCGEGDLLILQIDHVNDDGLNHRANHGPIKMFNEIIKGDNKSELQILCANCNTIKSHKLKQSWTSGQHERYRFLRNRAMEILGKYCINCNFSDPRALQINHKEGDGGIIVRSRGRYGFYLDIVEGKESIEGLELLCANCNQRYEYQRGYRNGYGFEQAFMELLWRYLFAGPPVMK